MPVTNIPSPGSPIRSNWAQSVSSVANTVEALVNRLTADTGWVNVAWGTGWTVGLSRARQIGPVGCFVVGVTRSGTSLSNAAQTPCTLPASVRPDGVVYVGAQVAGTMQSANFDGTGVLTFPSLTIATGQGMFFTVTWLRALP